MAKSRLNLNKLYFNKKEYSDIDELIFKIFNNRNKRL